MLRPSLVAIALAACHAPVPSDDSAAPPEAAPYLLDTGAGADGPIDVAGIEAALAETVGVARSLNGAPAATAYAAAMESASADCPSWYTDGNGLPYWYDACTTDAGASFSGYGYGIRYDDTDSGDGYRWTGAAIYTAATITTPDGASFTGSGSATALVGLTADGGIVYYSVVGGTFSTGSPTGTWLDGATPNLSMWLSDSSGWHGVYLSGSVPLAGAGYDIAVLDDVSIAAAETGWPCPGEVAGSIAVHGADGAWYEVLFDGGWEQDPATCDQCGSVWVDGVARGTACMDASSWAVWDSSPWE